MNTKLLTIDEWAKSTSALLEEFRKTLEKLDQSEKRIKELEEDIVYLEARLDKFTEQ